MVSPSIVNVLALMTQMRTRGMDQENKSVQMFELRTLQVSSVGLTSGAVKPRTERKCVGEKFMAFSIRCGKQDERRHS